MLKKIWYIANKNKFILILLSTIYNICGMNHMYFVGKGNKIYCKTAFLKKCKFNIKGNNNRIEFHDGVRLTRCKININANNSIIIINNYSTIINVEFHIEDNENSIIIGTKSNLFGGHFAVTENNSRLTIGDNCLFSKDVEIRTGDSHSIIDLTSAKRINYAKDVSIGNHVWVGAHVKILKGVNIPDDVIIANSAVVTKTIEKSHCVIGGFPGKVIKEDVTWQNERIYQ